MRHLVLLFPLLACTSERARSATGTAPTPPGPVKVNEVALALSKSVTLDADDPSTCERCHAQVVTEWRESLHSRAHHANDPLYAAMRTLRTQKQGTSIPGNCARCHTPRDVRDHESKAAKTGVSCATCHQLDDVHLGDEKKGVEALTWGPAKVFRGPHDVENGVSPVHGNGPALPALADGKTLCLACHGEERNAAGIATCSTGVEHQTLSTAGTCVSCHLPEVQGPSGAVSSRPTHRSHVFRGPHHAWRTKTPGLLAESVALSGRFENDRVIARLENLASHGFPTGFPARLARLDFVGFDGSGNEVFRNVTADPMKEHPQAVFNKGYVDAEGKPSLAPFATKLVRDARLTPGETREVTLQVPPPVVRVELRLSFFLVAPPAAKLMGYQGPELEPLRVATATVTR
ncbi:MAG: cytochrome c family protein [Myxococcaceae bacterium]|jgi:hypothetical protein|nr:cytochrome c family protein [Myxococcaceae bacterium]